MSLPVQRRGDALTEQTAWWNYLGVSNIVTDVAILAQAIIIIVRLRTNIYRKAILTSVFAFRVLSVMHSSPRDRVNMSQRCRRDYLPTCLHQPLHAVARSYVRYCAGHHCDRVCPGAEHRDVVRPPAETVP
jgi:hypothetical protein